MNFQLELRYNIKDKLINKICEYKYIVRKLCEEKELKENRIYNEKENITVDIDKLLVIYKNYKIGLCSYEEVEKFLINMH